MRPLGFRLPARLALATLFAAFLIPVLPIPAEAAGSLSLAVHAGYQDVVKLGEWMPVTIDAHNTGAAVDGTLQVQESIPAQPGVTGQVVYQEPISLAAGATKRVRIFIQVDNSAATVNAHIVQNGQLVASQNAVPSSNTAYLVAVLSDQTTTLDDIAAIHPASVAARVVHLQASELPDGAIALRAFDILAIDDFASDSLTAAQRNAISDFVSAGGDLLLGSGAAWHKTLGALPSSLLPMQVSGTTVLDTTSVGTAAVEIATGSLANGHVWLAQDGVPLLIERSLGAGTVTLATFDWNDAPIAVSGASNAVLRQVMSRDFFGSGGAGQNFNYPTIAGGAGIATPFNTGGPVSLASKSGALSSVLGNLPGLDLPSLQLTAALVVLYVIVVGPINYLVLRAARRRALAWVTTPLIAILAAGGAYGTGVITKGRSVQLNEVAIVHVQPGADRAYQEIYTGVIPPTRGDYTAAIGTPSPFLSSIINSYSGPGYVNSGLTVDEQGSSATLHGMTAFSLGGFSTEAIGDAPQLTASLRLVGGVLLGTVENHSNLTFTDAVIIAGGNYQVLPELKPGASAPINVTPKAANPFGQPLYMQIYNNNGDRESLTKTQVLSLLPIESSFKGVTAFTAPLLVAWTRQPFQQVSINGDHPRTTALSAVALSLPVQQIGTGPLPAGVVSSRIVDVVGDSQGQGPPGMLMLQNGSVTFEFSPPLGHGAQLTGISITSQNPYGAKFSGIPGSPNSGPALTGEAWDWATSSWVPINYVDNGTTALPNSAVDPQTGTVRVRITANNGGFVAGSLSLSGTVK